MREPHYPDVPTLLADVDLEPTAPVALSWSRPTRSSTYPLTLLSPAGIERLIRTTPPEGASSPVPAPALFVYLTPRLGRLRLNHTDYRTTLVPDLGRLVTLGAFSGLLSSVEVTSTARGWQPYRPYVLELATGGAQPAAVGAHLARYHGLAPAMGIGVGDGCTERPRPGCPSGVSPRHLASQFALGVYPPAWWVTDHVPGHAMPSRSGAVIRFDEVPAFPYSYLAVARLSHKWAHDPGPGAWLFRRQPGLGDSVTA
jgi:hypothetical protein